jgi:transcriptional regulator with XRE-family HTH domain
MLCYAPCTSAVSPAQARDQTEATARGRRYDVTGARFGRHIRSLRRARGLTQERLAERSDLSCDAIRRIENGRLSPTLNTLCKLARGLELGLSTLFAGIESSGRPLAAEIADYLAGRTPKECELAWRLVRCLFDDG